MTVKSPLVALTLLLLASSALAGTVSEEVILFQIREFQPSSDRSSS
jgi:hypothetical protein